MTSTRVMVVHDDPTFCEQLRGAMLQMSSAVEFHSAASAARAMAMIPSIQPDVYVVECELEEVDGFMLADKLARDTYAQGKPVVLVALEPTESSALRARQCGAAAHMPSTGPMDAIAGKVLALAGTPAPSAVTVGAGVQSGPRPRGGAGTRPGRGGYPGMSAPQAAPAAPPVTVPLAGLDIVDPSADPLAGDIPHVDDLLKMMLERGGSDLHLTVGSPPGIRVRGEIIPVESVKPLSPARHDGDDPVAAVRGAAPPLRDRARARLRVLDPRRIAVPRERVPAAQLDGCGLPRHPDQDPDDGRPRPAEGVPVPRGPSSWPCGRHRPDRLG